MKRIIGLFIIFLLAVPLISMAGEPATSFSGDCQCPGKKGYQRTATWADCVELCRGKSGSGSSSGATPSGDLGKALGTILGNAIVEAIRGNPEEDARRKAEEDARARRAAEEQARAAEAQRRAEEELLKKQEEMKNRLLGNMMNVDNSSQLGLMGVDSGPGLGLMTDSASAITPPAKSVPPVVEKEANDTKSAAYSNGFEHASQCISQNSGSACAGAAADQQQNCVADYRTGYDLGSKQRALVLQEAFEAGKGAGLRGELANAASDERAAGPCRIEWIESYNRGFFQGQHTKK